ITRTENILHRNFTRRQVAIQNRVASNIGISQSTFSVKVLNLFIHLSTPLIRLFLLVLILLLMPTLNFLPVWFAFSLLRFRLPSRLPMMFILWMVAMMVVIIPSRTV